MQADEAEAGSATASPQHDQVARARLARWRRDPAFEPGPASDRLGRVEFSEAGAIRSAAVFCDAHSVDHSPRRPRAEHLPLHPVKRARHERPAPYVLLVGRVLHAGEVGDDRCFLPRNGGAPLRRGIRHDAEDESDDRRSCEIGRDSDRHRAQSRTHGGKEADEEPEPEREASDRVARGQCLGHAEIEAAHRGYGCGQNAERGNAGTERNEGRLAGSTHPEQTTQERKQDEPSRAGYCGSPRARSRSAPEIDRDEVDQPDRIGEISSLAELKVPEEGGGSDRSGNRQRCRESSLEWEQHTEADNDGPGDDAVRRRVGRGESRDRCDAGPDRLA